MRTCCGGRRQRYASRSTIWRLDRGTNQFVESASVPTSGATDWEHFVLGRRPPFRPLARTQTSRHVSTEKAPPLTASSSRARHKPARATPCPCHPVPKRPNAARHQDLVRACVRLPFKLHALLPNHTTPHARVFKCGGVVGGEDYLAVANEGDLGQRTGQTSRIYHLNTTAAAAASAGAGARTSGEAAHDEL